MSEPIFASFTADQYEGAVADALADKNLQAAVSLIRLMAVHHPRRCLTLLDTVQATMDALRDSVGVEVDQ